MSIPRLSEASTISPSYVLRRTGSGPESLHTAPDLLGLEEVPQDAMTMLLTLPLSNNADATFASRYLRVSFVPFHDGGCEDNFPVTATGYVGPYGDEWNDNPTTPASHGHHTWYKRLARPFHAQSTGSGSGENVSDDEHHIASSRTTTNLGLAEEKCQSFRIIARVLANPKASELTTAVQQQRKISSALAQDAGKLAGSYAIASQTVNASLPQPFSFPVILGVYDQQGHLDLIPEGWQAIGLALGPAPAFVIGSTAGSAPDAARNKLSVATHTFNTAAQVSHPLRGVADVIIAGCAACMNL
jgi:hypothetical protein